MIKIFIGVLFTLISINTYAVIDTDKIVKIIGVQGDNGHFWVENNFAEPCKYNVMYFRIDTDFGKIAYSTLLTAKASQSKLRRISYTIDSSTQICTLGLVEIE